MLARKTRTHSCGQSNIDFRTQRDEINVKRFQPWKLRPNFGTMGSSDFHLKIKEQKELMHPTAKFNTMFDKNQEVPNPKFYSTAVFYNMTRVPIKQETFTGSDKVAELDESFKGKDKFTGDSMMIAETTKMRKKGTLLNLKDKLSKGNYSLITKMYIEI